MRRRKVNNLNKVLGEGKRRKMCVRRERERDRMREGKRNKNQERKGGERGERAEGERKRDKEALEIKSEKEKKGESFYSGSLR